MNQIHLQSVIIYLPIIGSIFGGFVLVNGLWTKHFKTKKISCNIFIISAIMAGIAYLIGEFTIGYAKTTIKPQDTFALFVLITFIILGHASILNLFLTLTKSLFTKTIAFIVIFISLITFGMMAGSDFLGTKFEHTEMKKSVILP